MKHLWIELLDRLDYESVAADGRVDSLIGEAQNGHRGVRISVQRDRSGSQRDTYIVRFPIENDLVPDGSIAMRVRLFGWDELRYIAIGFHDGKVFSHVKIRHVRPGQWLTYSHTSGDLILDVEQAAPLCDRPREARLFVKGIPSLDAPCGIDVGGVTIGVRDAAQDDEFITCASDVDESEEVAWRKDVWADLCEYLVRVHGSREVKRTGDLMDYERKVLVYGKSAGRMLWGLGIPEGIGSNTTLRYAWHGLLVVQRLVADWYLSGRRASLFHGAALTSEWIRSNLRGRPGDDKYTWYDHGTAERTIALLVLWGALVESGMFPGVARQLRKTIASHARLLANPAFYARNQATMYHNHACFQDLALVAVSRVWDRHREADVWLEAGLRRFEDQLRHLLVLDNGIAASVENSSGYHIGLQRLAETMRAMVADVESPRVARIHELIRAMDRFSKLIEFPEGGVASFGDTFRRTNPESMEARRPSRGSWKSPLTKVLPKAGYCVIRRNVRGAPVVVIMTASRGGLTHKHADDLSIIVYYDGVEWLIDPSFHSHEYTDSLPSFLRGPLAHNAPTVLEREYDLRKSNPLLRSRRGDGCFAVKGVATPYGKDVRIVRMLLVQDSPDSRSGRVSGALGHSAG